jgi:putative ABC transport system permease protein
MILLVRNFLNACEQLWANKMRSVLTVLGVIIAVTSTLVVVAVVQGFSGYVSNFLQGLGTNTMWVVPQIPQTFDRTVTRAEMVQGDIDEVSQSCPAVKTVAPLVVR